METILLNAKKREISGRKLKNMRASGAVPAVAYGNNFDNHSLEVGAVEFDKAFAKAGYSQLLDLDLGAGEPWKVLIKSVSYDPISLKPEHVDFLRIRMDEKVAARVPLELVGRSEGVTKWGGIMMQKLDNLKITCLPDKLFEKVVVDITPLNRINASIKVSDLEFPEGVEVINNPSDVVVTITESRASKKGGAKEASKEEATEGEAAAGEAADADKK